MKLLPLGTPSPKVGNFEIPAGSQPHTGRIFQEARIGAVGHLSCDPKWDAPAMGKREGYFNLLCG
ncbi:hypothetical protein [Poriferisphaera sp. WC338]|uniref:hypothetical protein n=1 Tax=Poriferisphaera sp. WC338 TaxID=3425129 RepID=UPI003D814CB5